MLDTDLRIRGWRCWWIVAAALASGCTAYLVPPATPPAPRGGPAARPLLFVTNSPDVNAAEAAALVEALRQTGLFGEVRGGAPTVADALVARPQPERIHCDSAAWPTLFTLGLWPHVTCVVTGYRFLLSGPGVLRETMIDTRRADVLVIGWAAGLLRLSPRWAGSLLPGRETAALAVALEAVLPTRRETGE